MISFLHNQIFLHAMAEVFDEFKHSNKTFKECCSLYNVDNLDYLFSSAMYNILLNNFCIQKDIFFNLTNNDDYINDDPGAYEFDSITIIKNNNNSNSYKKIIKEIRDAIEHSLFEFNDEYKSIHIKNNRTGFEAIVPMIFFINSFYSQFYARNINSVLVDDSKVEYANGFTWNIDKIKLYRIIAKNKNDKINKDDIYRLTRNGLIKLFLDNGKYEIIDNLFDDDQIELLKEYFNNHSFDKENMRFAFSAVFYNDSGFINDINQEFFSLLGDLFKYLNNSDIRYEELNKFDINKNCLELLESYLKMLFITDCFKNANLEDEERKHIRNCLCHCRYTKISNDTVLLCDHINGINNEGRYTFKKKYNINDLYHQAENLSFGYDSKVL